MSSKYFQEKTDYKSKYKRIWIEKEKRANVDRKRETKGIMNTSGKIVLQNAFI